mmetsp:Transcript_23197/g.64828  ORF Transcript_23197/g.64828 Transcript_23197/m.64828 type:complete len:283 (+) Transcript_23197:367-1215(+)
MPSLDQGGSSLHVFVQALFTARRVIVEASAVDVGKFSPPPYSKQVRVLRDGSVVGVPCDAKGVGMTVRVRIVQTFEEFGRLMIPTAPRTVGHGATRAKQDGSCTPSNARIPPGHLNGGARILRDMDELEAPREPRRDDEGNAEGDMESKTTTLSTPRLLRRRVNASGMLPQTGSQDADAATEGQVHGEGNAHVREGHQLVASESETHTDVVAGCAHTGRGGSGACEILRRSGGRARRRLRHGNLRPDLPRRETVLRRLQEAGLLAGVDAQRVAFVGASRIKE